MGRTPIIRKGAPAGLGSLRPSAAVPGAPGPRAATRKRRSVHPALVWGGAGFIAGAIFWQAIDVRAVLSEVVLQGSREARADEAREAPTAGAAAAGDSELAKVQLPTIYLIDPANCTALALDRKSNRTSVRPCPSNGLALRLEPEGEREDVAGLPAVKTIGYRAD